MESQCITIASLLENTAVMVMAMTHVSQDRTQIALAVKFPETWYQLSSTSKERLLRRNTVMNDQFFAKKEFIFRTTHFWLL